MKENIFKGLVAAAAAAVGAYCRELIFPVVILVLVMVADYVSGMARSWVKNELSSRVGIVGIVKKVCYAFAVAVAIVADWIIQAAAAQMGLDLGTMYFFALIVTVWLIINECISILENISEIGVPLPPFLLALMEKLKKTAEDRGEEGSK